MSQSREGGARAGPRWFGPRSLRSQPPSYTPVPRPRHTHSWPHVEPVRHYARTLCRPLEMCNA